MVTSLQSILDLYGDRGQAQYGGEAVSQLEHALQSAHLAELADQPPELVAACFFHDLGHLVHPLGEDVAVRGIDDRHEWRAMPLLKQLFPTAVTAPIQLHVDAKRYLCAVDRDYWAQLSPVSKRSLELQGGVFSEAEAEAFIKQPGAEAAVRLRRWDDQAKVAQLQTPDVDHFRPAFEAALKGRAAVRSY
ncbi:phosphohydrolase [filamentous cyanobacterium CCP5]|nr:phosphohydrolase [filamentous cyanobacterium CCP5]